MWRCVGWKNPTASIFRLWRWRSGSLQTSAPWRWKHQQFFEMEVLLPDFTPSHCRIQSPTRQWTFRAHKKRVIYWPGGWLSKSQETIFRYVRVRNVVLHTMGKTQLWVLVKRALSNMFRPKRKEVAGDWRKLHSEEFPDMQSSPNIIRVIKPRIRKAEHVASMGEKR